MCPLHGDVFIEVKRELELWIKARAIQGQLWIKPGGSVVMNSPAMQQQREMQVCSLGQEGPLEEEMATHSGILAWRIPWTEEPGGLQSMGSQRVGHG